MILKMFIFFAVINFAFSTEVTVYDLFENDVMVVNNTFTEQLSDNFSICLYFLIDKFGNNDDVTILKLKQRKGEAVNLRILVKMHLTTAWGLPIVMPKIIVNGEFYMNYSNMDIKKDIWNFLCLGIDWTQKNLGLQV